MNNIFKILFIYAFSNTQFASLKNTITSHTRVIYILFIYYVRVIIPRFCNEADFAWRGYKTRQMCSRKTMCFVYRTLYNFFPLFHAQYPTLKDDHFFRTDAKHQNYTKIYSKQRNPELITITRSGNNPLRTSCNARNLDLFFIHIFCILYHFFNCCVINIVKISWLLFFYKLIWI